MLRAPLTSPRCRKSIELHEKRHRAIVTLRDSLLQLANEGTEGIHPVSGLSGNGKSYQPNNAASPTKAEKTDQSSGKDHESLSTVSTNAKGKKAVKEAWNTQRKTPSSPCLSPITKVVENDGALIDANSVEASSFREDTEDIPVERLLRAKHADPKSRNIHTRFLTSQENENIEEALHPSVDSLVDEVETFGGNINLTKNDIIDANITFRSATTDYSSIRSVIASRKRKTACKDQVSKSNSSTVDDAKVTAALQRLGISNEISSNGSKACKSLLGRLRHAVHVDLVIFENEERETMMRMAGYWRYVSRRTYNAMVRNNQLWDWATGAKLEELEVSDQEAEDDEVRGIGDRDISSLSERGHHGERYDSPSMTHVNKGDDTKGDTCRSNQNDDAVSYPASQDPNPKSPWTGIKDTRHLSKKPPDISSSNARASEPAFAPYDTTPLKPLSLRLRNPKTSNDNDNDNDRKKPPVITITSTTTIPASATATVKQNKHTGTGNNTGKNTGKCVTLPKTSLRGPASYADTLKKAMKS